MFSGFRSRISSRGARRRASLLQFCIVRRRSLPPPPFRPDSRHGCHPPLCHCCCPSRCAHAPCHAQLDRCHGACCSCACASSPWPLYDAPPSSRGQACGPFISPCIARSCLSLSLSLALACRCLSFSLAFARGCFSVLLGCIARQVEPTLALSFTLSFARLFALIACLLSVVDGCDFACDFASAHASGFACLGALVSRASLRGTRHFSRLLAIVTSAILARTRLAAAGT